MTVVFERKPGPEFLIMSQRLQCRRGFTLLEFLVVLAVVSFLAAAFSVWHPQGF